MPERLSVSFSIGERTQPARRETDNPEPFRIAVFGDFSGHRRREGENRDGSAQPIRIDRDNFDEVLARLRPALELTLGEDNQPVSMTFASLDDFHPDSLFRRLPLFAHPGESRPLQTAPAKGRHTPEAPDLSSLSRGSLLDQMVEAQSEDRPAVPDELQTYVSRLVAGALVPAPTREQEEAQARTEGAFAQQMRALLHHPDFQALESAWRGLSFLVRRLETDANLQIHMVDLSRQELHEALTGAGNLRDTGFYRQVVGNARTGPWALLAGIYEFGPGAEDVELLARIGMIAAQAQAPFLAAAAPRVLGCEAFQGIPEPRDWQPDPSGTQFWRALRELPDSPWLGLLLPRFLLRLPYGAETSPIEAFPFEEMPGVPAHQEYLWGNPAFAGALLLGQTFSEDGWQMQPGSIREIPGLPVHSYQQEGEAVMQPCAEAWLTDRAAEAILDAGIMPLASNRSRDSAQLVRFQSVADPLRPLAGRWP